MGAAGEQPTLWFDVEDLFEHMATSARPSGIQRATFEIYRALIDDPTVAGRIRFVRHDRLRRTLRVVGWAEVALLFTRPSRCPGEGFGPRPAGPVGKTSWMRHLAERLQPGLRQRLLRLARLQAQAGLALAELAEFLAVAAVRRLLRAVRPRRQAEGGDFASLARPGDMLAVLGAPWVYFGYAALVAEAKERCALRLTVLVHDVIPVMRPEWFPPAEVARFRACLSRLLPMADVLLAVSRATAADLVRFAAADALTLRAPVRVIPLGSGFVASGDAPVPASAAELPRPGSYVLFVSTLEARKNHLLLFQVWRRLLQEMPPDAVPTLVFAGRPGALVEDLMRQLRNCDYLGGKIRLFSGLSDTDLIRLYRGCLLTVFPSLYEGWGLPVTESLAFGKPCLAARSSALPEAGGTLARYFDPESVSDAYAIIRATIEDTAGMRAWQADVVRDFVPTSWRETAGAMLRAMREAPARG